MKLQDGRVLVFGGVEANGGRRLSSSELYEPDAGMWRPAGSMQVARWGGSSLLLPDGRVLAIGGAFPNRALVPLEAFDIDGGWSALSSSRTVEPWHTSVLLLTGAVLVAGGDQSDLRNWALYEPASNQWRSNGVLQSERRMAQSVILSDGGVLVIGGELFAASSPRAEVFTGGATASSCGVLSTERSAHVAARLPSGSVVVAGGYNPLNYSVYPQPEVLPAGSCSWVPAGNMAQPRAGAATAVLGDGSLLMIGGYDATSLFGTVERFLGR